MSQRITRRDYYSIRHIESAAFFARQAYAIEQTKEAYEDIFNDATAYKFHSEHRAFVIGTIFNSTAFLEATANELFCDARDRGKIADSPIEKLDEGVQQLMARMWEHGVPQTASYPIQEKYEIALSLAGKEPFDTGNRPYQDVAGLIKLRNALIHYEPTLVELEVEAKNKLTNSLRGRFQENPLPFDADDKNWFPHKCLSHGCADWAVRYSVEFVNLFFNKIGSVPVYLLPPFSVDIFQQRIKTTP